MTPSHLSNFSKDQEGSAALEYFVLVGILGLVWLMAANEYKAHLLQAFADLSRELSRVKF
ncbi:hypothetical protein [Cohaesibacter celericrescens]|uniref:Flp family type IVb pilin n=1 Tax=Cohaesibacter celericrescens TaxID=2067669 RepID=A0A2N5XVJ9_9HYPH|nr:hypothetical protein [Cohaesibacter celericrescens]PLW78541.1 hypothetical protein C0081_04035 [Cohaesibacter celericrescens]